MTRIVAAFLLLLGLAACVTNAASPAKAIYVMRHLQKGSGDDPQLSAEGRTNAQRLFEVLKRDLPKAIFVSTTRRARETAEPLAERLGITLTPYDPRNAAALIEAIEAEERNVLIIGHSNTVPDIIGRLGGTAPPPLSEEDYGDIWRIDGRTRAVTKIRISGD